MLWNRFRRVPAIKASPNAIFLCRYTAERKTKPLRLHNSLTNSVQSLLPPESEQPLKWYGCGPTVYDHAHLGHARTYVTQDILYRVLTDHFRYDVFYVMGITDVDDKIINAANNTEQSIQEWSRDFEASFFQELDKLNVRRPSAVVRVSEHIDEIIAYIQQIQENQYGYVAPDGSGVYFDTQAFGEGYGKLDPDRNRQSTEIANEDKGKRNSKDFALWKTAKEGEPFWPSPWGNGRPGWHIECSAMTHHIFGEALDLHTGGMDLCFPHHNNEIAQCEAHNGKAWCNHFVHFGQLNIKGLKMSKSLKNYITIKALLESYSADQFRIFCLQHKYNSLLHYSDDRMQEAKAVVDKFHHFFETVEALGRSERANYFKKTKKWGPDELKLYNSITECKNGINEALLDDMDTGLCLKKLLHLISESNTYISSRLEKNEYVTDVLYEVGALVLQKLDLFGLEDLVKDYRHIRYPWSTSSSIAGPQDTMGMIETMMKFRAAVREEGLKKDSISWKHVLALCDDARDEMASHGIQIEDTGSGSSWRKAALSASNNVAPQEPNKSSKKTANSELGEYVKILPEDLFKKAPQYANMYSAYDQDGIPTHDIDGKELSKTARKKLTKKKEKHEQLRQKHKL